MAKNVLENLGRALENGANVVSGLAFRSPKAGLSSLPGVNMFHHTGKGFYLNKFL